jgi:uncharacterized protein (DUF1778 family)
MSTDADDRDDEWVGLRVAPEKKRAIKMRAADRGDTVSDYLEGLVDEDLEGVEYVDV